MSGFWWGFWWGVVAVAAFMIIAPNGRTVNRCFAQIGWLAYRASMGTLNRQRRIEREERESR